MRKIWTGGAVVALVACGAAQDAISSAASDAGELARDAGGALMDAGQWLADAGSQVQDASDRADSGASAQDATFEQKCDEVYERVMEIRSDAGDLVYTRTDSYWFATFDVDGTTGVDIVTCGRVQYGDIDACPDNATCTGNRPPDRTDCRVGESADLGDGFVRVQCGNRTRFVYPSGEIYDAGQRYERAKLTVRR